MALASAAVVLSAAAVVLMAMAPLQLSAAADTLFPTVVAPVPIGLPGCDATCGNVSVPYPFGFGPSHCYWPGLNLTCDSHLHPPRLLLGDAGSHRVVGISLSNQTIRVMRAGSIINTTGDLSSPGWNASLGLGRGFREHGYLLSAQNELVVSGCNVMATISADIVGEETTKIVSGCASFCTKSDRGGVLFIDEATDKYCTGTSGCCLAPVTSSGVPVPNGVHARWLDSGSHIAQPVTVFVAEHGWAEKQLQQTRGVFQFEETPILLDFALMGLPPHSGANSFCSQDIQRMVCKSDHSDCVPTYQGYACYCRDGYDGNPYLAGGCQDVDECKLLGKERVCFGVCINTAGSYDCQCPHGTYGDPEVQGGCVDYNFNTDVALDRVPTGLTNCSTSCGSVSVPYPFGFGHPGCYWPGLHLTCDTSHSPPRLLLHGNGDGGGTLQVIDISLRNSTMHVIHHHSQSMVDFTAAVDQKGVAYSYDNATNVDPLVVDVRLPSIGEPYALSTRNEFIIISPRWDLRATLHGEYRNGNSSGNTDSIISRAVCSSGGPVGDRGYCSGHDGCCRAPIFEGSTPKKAKFEALNKAINRHYVNWPWYLTLAFISEVGLIDHWQKIFNMNDNFVGYTSSPIVLEWAVKQGFSATAADNNSGKCPGDLCKSEHSDCWRKNGGYTCNCSAGYFGNPYIAHGCQDLCNATAASVGIPCFGYCKLKPGGQQPPIDCQCPRGTHGDPYRLYGCVKSPPPPIGLIVGVAVAGGPALLLLVLGIILLRRKIKQHGIKVQKQKYFKQNRGQLLQQFLSQKADIAERMIKLVRLVVEGMEQFTKESYQINMSWPSKSQRLPSKRK